MMKHIFPAFCLCLLWVAPAYAADSVASADYVSSIKEKAQRGDAISEFNLGVLYHTGQGMPQDDKKAAAWLRKAADQGDSDAELNLATLYHDGQGVPQDYKKAAAWCQRSAEQGNVKAQFYLSTLYKKGEGVPQDKNLAVGWLVRAVKNGGHLLPPQEAPKAALSKEQSVVLCLAVAFAILMAYLGLIFFRRRTQ